MTNRRRFILSGLMLTAVAVTMRTVQLVLGAYVSRTVGAEALGLNTLVMTVYAFAVTLATSGISLTVTRLVASALTESGSRGVRGTLSASFIYASFFGALSTVILLSLSGPISRSMLSDIRATRALAILALSLLPLALSGVISGYFVAVRRVGRNALLQVLSQATRIILTVLLLSRGNGGVAESVTALAVGCALTELMTLILGVALFTYDVLRHGLARPALPRMSAVVGTAMPLALSAYVRSLLLTLEHSLIPERLRLYRTGADRALADYGVLHGMALPTVLYPMAPLSSYAGLLVPEFASGGRMSRLRRIATEALGTTLAYCGALTVMMGAFAEEIGYVLYGSFEAGRYIAILAPVIPIMYLDHVADAMLKGIGEQVYSMWVNIADSLLSVVLVYFLLPVMGIEGYALVIIIMELFNFTLSFMRLRKRVGVGVDILRAFPIPFLSAITAYAITSALFHGSGSAATFAYLCIKFVFALSCFYCVLRLLLILRGSRRQASGRSL